MTAAAAITQLL